MYIEKQARRDGRRGEENGEIRRENKTKPEDECKKINEKRSKIYIKLKWRCRNMTKKKKKEGGGLS